MNLVSFVSVGGTQVITQKCHISIGIVDNPIIMAMVKIVVLLAMHPQYNGMMHHVQQSTFLFVK